MIRGIMSSADNVVGAVDVLKARAGKSQKGRKQSSQSEQIAASAEEMSQTITDIAGMHRLPPRVQRMRGLCRFGKDIMEIVLTKVNNLFVSTEELQSMVNRLNGRVSDRDHCDVIKDIADQTNLLALNAAIEQPRR